MAENDGLAQRREDSPRMRLRAATEADAEAAHAVMAARDLADLGVVDFTLADLREEWGFPDVDIAKDVVVGEDESAAIVAYGIVRRMGVVCIVHPDHEGKGWGTRLLEWSENRAAERGQTFRRQFLNEGNERARALLEAAGYRKQRSYARMGRVLDGAVEEPRLPAGVRLRPLDTSADAEELHAVDHAASAVRPTSIPSRSSSSAWSTSRRTTSTRPRASSRSATARSSASSSHAGGTRTIRPRATWRSSGSIPRRRAPASARPCFSRPFARTRMPACATQCSGCRRRTRARCGSTNARA
jgi:GNAT superfamily N-acetyltransferase